jgi:uncharacterized protein (DUF1697 family)
VSVLVALLRGVNVGGRGTMPMTKLKAAFEDLGCTDVRTYINSGNVVFRDRRRPTTVARLAEEALGAHITVRTLAQMEALCARIPDEWANDNEQKTDVGFALDGGDDLLWHALRKDLAPREGPGWEREVTARNVNTVRKLLAMMHEL